MTKILKGKKGSICDQLSRHGISCVKNGTDPLTFVKGDVVVTEIRNKRNDTIKLLEETFDIELEGLMTTEQAAKILKAHNEWRRGGDGEMADPKDLGKAIDKAVEVLLSQK